MNGNGRKRELLVLLLLRLLSLTKLVHFNRMPHKLLNHRLLNPKHHIPLSTIKSHRLPQIKKNGANTLASISALAVSLNLY